MTVLRVHPDRVRDLLGASLSDRTIARLLDSRRLQGRLAARLPPEEQGDGSGDFVAEYPLAAARRAGALLYAQALRAVLSGPDVKALVGTIGRDAHGFALRHGADAPPRAHDGDLGAAILCDGELCLGAWLAERPPALRKRVLMQLPVGTQIEAGPFPADIAARAEAVFALVTGGRR